MRSIRISTFIFAVVASSIGSLLAYSNSTANALSASDWNASNIIDDAVFYDNTSMSTTDIQAFMNSKNPSCDTNGTKPASEYGRSDLTRAQYATQVAGWPGPPYVCLRDYYQVPRSDQNINNLSTNVRPEGSISAAEIIKRASDTYGVSPKVLLVLIQKESVGPLLTDTWPIPAQYRSVVGYGCPDTAPCDAKYAGFYNQIMNAAYQFKYYKDHAYDKYPDGRYWYNHQPYNTVSLRFNPNINCGSTWTRMDNYATTGLYNYTPYQPNRAALDDMYGYGDDCSAHGNRNFWTLFINWFGSVRGYKYLDTQRWMTVSSATYKKDPVTGQNIGPQLPSGTQLYFVDKTYINGQWYIRTEYDKHHNLNQGVPQSALGEIAFQSFSEPRYLEATRDTQKTNPITRWWDQSQTFPKNSRTLFKGKVLINNVWFYRTAYDQDRGQSLSIPADRLKEVEFEPFETPRYMRIKANTHKTDPIRIQSTQSQESSSVAQGAVLHFDNKVRINNQWFYRTSADTISKSPLAIPSETIEEVPYVSYSSSPTWLQLKADSTKIHPSSGLPIEGEVLKAGTQIKIVDQVLVNGTMYLRTQFDSDHSLDKGLTESSFEQIPYIAMEQPRELRLTTSVRKRNPVTGIESGDTLPQGTKIQFVTKIIVNGEVFLRTQYDTSRDNNLTIPVSLLKDLD